MIKTIKSALVLIIIFSFISSCKDRIFDNPFDPDKEEQGYQVEATIPINGLIAVDITFSGDSIWIIDNDSRLISLNYNSGNIIRELNIGGNPALNGICYNGVDLWLNIRDTAGIIRVSIINGETIKNINLPEGSYSVMDHFNSIIYIVDKYSNSIQLINPETGEITRSIPNPSFSADGICFDGKHIWILDAPALKIHRLDLDGKVLAVYQTPDKNPTGLCFSQGIIWCGDRSGKIFKLRFPPLNNRR